MKAVEVSEVDAVTALATQVESLRKKVDGIMAPRAALVMLCATCRGGHLTNDSPIVSASARQHEQVDFVSGVK